ncbi:nucleotidyltransferase family protein [Patescibacteria group bacterium]|nr:nucleotidyltransferase family protein [Patescibacteria group bacterium]
MAKTKALNLERITNILKEHKEELKEKYGVKEIGIFGSHVRGEQKRVSDIDILIEFKPDARISLLDFVGIENYIGDLLEAKVDLVEKSGLKPRIGKHILREVVYL